MTDLCFFCVLILIAFISIVAFTAMGIFLAMPRIELLIDAVVLAVILALGVAL